MDIPNFDAMRQIDIETADPATLVDIDDVVIDADLPREERILDYIRQIKNPYLCKSGNLVVKIVFADTDMSLPDRLKQCFDISE